MADFDFTQLKGRMAQAGKGGHVELSDLERNALIDSAMEGGGEVDTDKIVDGAVTAPKIADSSITTEKLADKQYQPIVFSGMGQKHLKKNIVGGQNILTSAMVSEANTIYHIQYDYDLNGQTLTIPEGCILKFEGGSLNNGSVKLQRTFVDCDKNGFYNVAITSDSTIENKEMRLSWFKPQNGDYADILTNICNITYISNIYLDIKDVVISHPVVITKRGGNIIGKKVYATSDWDLLIQEMSTIKPAADYSANGYGRNAAFHFTTLQIGTFSNIYIEGAYKFGYGFYFETGYTGSGFSSNVIRNCYIAGLCMYITENTYIKNNRFYQCGTGIFVSNRLIDEENVLNIDNRTDVGADNWLTIEGNDIAFCNYGIVGRLGSNTNIVRTGISHCSCYAIFCQNYHILSIQQCYFEGDGKSSFWISDTGIEGDTDGTTMCDHLLNEHLGEFGKTVTQGWGISNYLFRGAVMIAGRGTTSVDGCMLSTNQIRTTYQTTGMRNLDNSACGLDCAFETLDGQNLSLNNLKSPDQSNFVKYMSIIAQYDITYNYGSVVLPKITYNNVNNTETFVAGFVNNYEIIKNYSAKNENGNFHEIIKENTKANDGSASFTNLSFSFKYNGVYNGIRMFEAFKATSSAANTFVFRIPKSFFTETKILRLYLRVTSDSENYNVQFRNNTAWQTNAPTYTITKELSFYEYVVDPESVDDTDGFILSVYGNAGTPLVLFSPLFARSIEQQFSDEIKLDKFNEIYLPCHGWNMEGARYAKSLSAGATYYDTRNNKYVMYNGTSWVNMDGTALS